jgi:hypothetical protein
MVLFGLLLLPLRMVRDHKLLGPPSLGSGLRSQLATSPGELDMELLLTAIHSGSQLVQSPAKQNHPESMGWARPQVRTWW